MSRNLMSTVCVRCDSDVTLLEPIRLATAADVGRYADEYAGKLWVAKAECGCCGARYLAWCANCSGRSRWEKVDGVCDLSFLSTFNDEDGPGDLPPWEPPLMSIKITGTRTPAESVAALRFLMSVSRSLKPSDCGEGIGRLCDADPSDSEHVFWVYAWRDADGALCADVRDADGVKREEASHERG
jgi:hypothetical protein